MLLFQIFGHYWIMCENMWANVTYIHESVCPVGHFPTYVVKGMRGAAPLAQAGLLELFLYPQECSGSRAPPSRGWLLVSMYRREKDFAYILSFDFLFQLHLLISCGWGLGHQPSGKLKELFITFPVVILLCHESIQSFLEAPGKAIVQDKVVF